MITLLVEESGLFVGDSEFAIDGGEDALYLSEGEHTAKESITSVVAMTALIHDTARSVGEGHTMVYTHGQSWILLLEDAAELDEVSTSSEV